jgi:putative nucleotidyltransferase with HDIG domain
MKPKDRPPHPKVLLQVFGWLGLGSIFLLMPDILPPASQQLYLVGGVVFLFLGLETYRATLSPYDSLYNKTLDILNTILLFLWGGSYFLAQDWLPGLAIWSQLLMLAPMHKHIHPRLQTPVAIAGINLLAGTLTLLVYRTWGSGLALILSGALFFVLYRQKLNPALLQWLPFLGWAIYLDGQWQARSLYTALPLIAVFFTQLLYPWIFTDNAYWKTPRRLAAIHMILLLGWGGTTLTIAILASSITQKRPIYIAILLLTLIFHVAMFWIVLVLNQMVNGILGHFNLPLDAFAQKDASTQLPVWLRWLPLVENTIYQMQQTIQQQQETLATLQSQRDAAERAWQKYKNMQEIERSLHPVLDKPVAAQILVNQLRPTLGADLVATFIYLPDEKAVQLLAHALSEDLQFLSLALYKQPIQKGLIGRSFREKQLVYVADTLQDIEYVFPSKEVRIRSEMVVPLLHQGFFNGCIVVSSLQPNAFDKIDQELLERAAELLLHAWERDDAEQRKQKLLRQPAMFSRLLHSQQVLEEAARLAQETLEARFVFITLLQEEDGSRQQTAQAGQGLLLEHSLKNNPNMDEIVQQAASHITPLHLRDIRRTRFGKQLRFDSPRQQDVLIIPIRLESQVVGLILAFGKQNGVTFTASDYDLALLLGNQVSTAIENAWLYEETLENLKSHNRLYQLSLHLLQSTTVQEAAQAILASAQSLTNASDAGISLYDTNGKSVVQAVLNPSRSTQPTLKEISLHFDDITIVEFGENLYRLYLPLRTPSGQYGAIWLNIDQSKWKRAYQKTALHMLANQASVALERLQLLQHTRQQAVRLSQMVEQLQEAYDKTLIALTKALDARDRETEGHSVRVSELTVRLGEEMGLSARELHSLRRGALLHDIGKIGVSDTILHKPGKLTEEEWRIMRKHPEIGANIIRDIPFLRDTIEVILYHQERWDGSGYPFGMKGEEIPLKARIFAVADALDALTSTRPYRQKLDLKSAMNYIRSQAGKEFDPKVVAALEKLYRNGELETYLE